MKILVFTEKPFAPAAVKAIENTVNASGNDLEVVEGGTRADLLEAVKNANGLIVRSDKIDGEVMDAAPELKVIVRAGAGYDNIDLAAATAHGICVTRIANGFGMKIEALDKFVPDAAMESEGVKPVHTPEELFSQNDFVSLHIPATPETRNSIGYDLVMKMPKGGVLVNTARKEVIDEEGLIKALEERSDLRYVSDIKPDRAEEFEQKFAARVFFTPKKMGAQTAEANFNAGVAAAEQTIAFLKDGWNKFQVNK